MSKDIKTIIIARRTSVDDVISNYERAADFIREVNPIFLENEQALKQVLEGFAINTKFRLLVHPKMKGHFGEADLDSCETTCNTIKSFTNCEHIKPQFITRADKVKSLCSSEKKYFVNFGGYEFCYASYINGCPEFDTPSYLDFINSITIFSKNEMENSKIALLTALVEDEYSICTGMMDGIDRNNYFIGKYKNLEHSDYKNLIQVYSQNDVMGMVESAIKSQGIIQNQNPEILLLGGVCGGRKEKKVNIYDVIIPSKIVDLFTGKWETSEKDGSDVFKPYSYTCEIENKLIAKIKKVVTSNDFINEMLGNIPKGNYKEKERLRVIISAENFKIHTDILACGAFILKKDSLLDAAAEKINDKIVGYEMESYGFVKSCNESNKLSLVVKSVMDFTDSKKSDSKENISTKTNSKSKKDPINNIPEGEEIKKMASNVSFICIRTLLPHIEKFLSEHRESR